MCVHMFKFYGESGTVLWGILSRARVGSLTPMSTASHSNDDHHDRRLNVPRPGFSFPKSGHFYHLSLGMTIRHIWMTFVSVLDISGLSNARTAVKIDLSTFLTKFFERLSDCMLSFFRSCSAKPPHTTDFDPTGIRQAYI